MTSIFKKMMIPFVLVGAVWIGGYFILDAFLRNDAVDAFLIFVGGMSVLYGVCSWLNGDY